MASSAEARGGKESATHSSAQRVARVLLAALLLPAPPSHAGNSTAAFLKIPVDARAVGLGSGVTAVSEGAAAITNNPAGLGLSARRELSLLYAPHVQGTDLSFLAYGQPTRFGSFGLSHLMLRAGALDGRDDEGRPTGGFTAEDRALGLSWAAPIGRVPLGGQIAAGLHVKYVTSRIGSYQGSTYALDLGAQSARRVAGLPARLGVSVRNLGPGLKLEERSDPLPLNVVVGLAVQPLQMMTLTVGAARYLADDRSEFSIGSELSPFSALVVRGNYGMVGSGGRSSQMLPLVSWGLGMRFDRYQFDYALMPLGDLGSTQRLNLTMRFGEARARPGPLARVAPSPGGPIGRDRVRSASDRDKDSIEERLEGARQAIRDGRFEVAARRAAEAAEVAPDDVRAWELLGSAQYLLGSPDRARQAWERALRLDPRSERVTEFLKRLR